MAGLTFQVPNFEGPLDLLLHLIRSQKIDIYDIPIAQITQQYLDYLQRMQDMNLQIAGEYFVMSSTLLRIKSQYLLPKNDFDSGGEEEEDPREELVQQLVQYSVFKKVSRYLQQRGDKVPVTAAKEASVRQGKGASKLPAGQVSSSQLANTFALVLRRFRFRQPEAASISVKEVSVQSMVSLIRTRLSGRRKLSFFKLASEVKTLPDIIGLFLAVLIMCRKNEIKVKQARTFGDLDLEGTKGSDGD